VSVLVDTSIWSMALRRDQPVPTRELEVLRTSIERGEACLLGVILQEVLQGFPRSDRTRRLVERLAPFPLLSTHRGDYVFAAEVRNHCRSKGLAISTVAAQIAAAAINHRCTLLTVDRDFEGIARHFPLRLA
jgi:predicted nucleic acid-binding protein